MPEATLKPRWKVIATFPENEDYPVGAILDRDWCKYVNGEDESQGTIWKISDFPHLFKELKWYEEVDLEDMPKFIRAIEGPSVGLQQNRVYKVKKWNWFLSEEMRDENMSRYFCMLEKPTSYHYKYNAVHFEPASEEEYNLQKI